uniref:rRNA methyltransferase 2, mitochondrial n=1 Tax=Parastrongyloides trichosuri TaxID=131310 RepID=A0A0N4Z6H2_PARTI
MVLWSGIRNGVIKTKNSKTKEYLSRQLNDEFSKKAREHNYRARSVFKLKEMDEKYKLFKEDDIVIDVGCAPGSWSQYLVEKIKPEKGKGLVLGIDLKTMVPINGATLLSQSDITKESVHNKIKEILDKRLVNAVVSDMAPNPCGDKRTDQIRLVNLCREVVNLFTKYEGITLRNDGIFLCKVWEGDSRKELTEELKVYFENIKILKPKACRDDSAELYILGRKFINKNDKK